jgi:hypothetical protein
VEVSAEGIGEAFMSFESTGGSGDVGPDDRRSLTLAVFSPRGTAMETPASATYPVSGLSPGSHTFTAKYRTGLSGAVFAHRHIIVVPLP